MIRLQELHSLILEEKRKGRSVALAHFDGCTITSDTIDHIGQCRAYADILVVTITFENPIENTQHFQQVERLFSSFSEIDHLCILDTGASCSEFLTILPVNIFLPWLVCKKGQFKEQMEKLTDLCRKLEIELKFTDAVLKKSNSYSALPLPDEVKSYIEDLKSRIRKKELLDLIEQMGSLRVAVVGDAILDEYRYCRPLGISSKDPVLAVQHQRTDLFAGGALAVANHVANFAGSVGLFTMIGQQNSQEDFIRSSLNPKITPTFMIQKGAPTLVKRRYVESYSLNKLFEVYLFDESGLNEEVDGEFQNIMKESLANYDLVVAADFGHGAISDPMRSILVDQAPFLAVNTQANSGNRGFHSISRYLTADFICIAEHELRLEMRDNKSDAQFMIRELAAKLKSKKFIVTRGNRGCLICDENLDLFTVPAFAYKVIDRIGAGDAFFSITAMAAYLGARVETLGVIGNTVGALAVAIMGNKRAVDKESVLRLISTVLD